MKRKLSLLMLLTAACLLGAVSCENYEKVPQNDQFLVEAVIGNTAPGQNAVLTIYVVEGASEGDCTLGLSIKDSETGYTPAFQVLYENGSKLQDAAVWSFKEDGSVRFLVSGLPQGKYEGVATVKRWYHSATCTFTFKVEAEN